ncbi:MAG: TonB-dependent receptor [Nevskia sp.]|jgi:outer membrane receptor protein involved in Fe transport|nr:TonB-dependent receptor [Nevskia sp.]
MRFTIGRVAAAAALFPFSGYAAEPAISNTALEPVQVTATRIPEPANRVPASITLITGDELRARGANDLRTALSFVAGVEASPGGDGGPAGAVAALWGLREMDAYLLVVDGVPWGGAFNPATATVNLNDVERIEVVRGAAPVLYGATSFVGVIHVIHYAAGQSENRIHVGGGRFGSVNGGLSTSLPSLGGYEHSFSIDGERRQFSNKPEDASTGHLLYRGASALGAGKFRVDADITLQAQFPDSPVVREGPALTALTPLDRNFNPSNAKLDENRYHFALGYTLPTLIGAWDTTASYTYSTLRDIRGFLREDLNDDGEPNADGFSQHRNILDTYFDSHFTIEPLKDVEVVYGADLLYGLGRQSSGNFEYAVPLNGPASAPSSNSLNIDEVVSSRDRRAFAGLYLQGDWKPDEAWDFFAGLRLNYTDESKRSALNSNVDPAESTADNASRTKTRLSGTVGASYRFFHQGRDEAVLYADYRNTFKPAAYDFGFEYEPEILKPETAQSYEVGLKGKALDGRLEWDTSAFLLNFKNLVVTGNGVTENAGAERFQGGEVELRFRPFKQGVLQNYQVLASYSYHDSRFRNYTQDFGGQPLQLRGRQLELSPTHLAAYGLLYAPKQGLNASLIANYVGDRYLNRRNTASAGDYFTYDAQVGYRYHRIGISLNGYNLGNARNPVAESEFGEGSYYRLPARTVLVNLSYDLR